MKRTLGLAITLLFATTLLFGCKQLSQLTEQLSSSSAAQNGDISGTYKNLLAEEAGNGDVITIKSLGNNTYRVNEAHDYEEGGGLRSESTGELVNDVLTLKNIKRTPTTKSQKAERVKVLKIYTKQHPDLAKRDITINKSQIAVIENNQDYGVTYTKTK